MLAVTSSTANKKKLTIKHQATFYLAISAEVLALPHSPHHPAPALKQKHHQEYQKN
jgi:hypothetical protein